MDFQNFLQSLNTSPYGEFLCVFPPDKIGTHNWQFFSPFAPQSLQPLVDFLLLGKRVPIALLDILLPGHQFLLNEGISESTDGISVEIPNLCLVMVGGCWIWVQRPQVNPTVYIGHDTFGLLARLRVARAERALDLCSGPGTQGVYLASKGARVVAVEVNPIAATIARLNARMNKVDDNFKLHVDRVDGFLSSTTDRFDLVCANPPLLPFPNEEFYPFVGHGGDDGMAITWTILQRLDRILTPSGRAQIIGTCISDGYLPVWLDELKEIALKHGLDVDISILGHSSLADGAPALEGLISTSITALPNRSRDELKQKYLNIVSMVNGSHLCYFFIFARVGRGRVEVADYSEGAWPSLWFTN